MVTVFAPVDQVDLHSIMVGFNRVDVVHVDQVDEIYIPLWSDSITLEWSLQLYGTDDLHSIMVGFNRLVERRQCVWWLIYIPLWSDSILSAEPYVPLLSRFTFHYGRIHSLGLHRVLLYPFQFTFHYGRIQSRTSFP